jgi:Mg-chelatase subunit ChlD
MSPALRRLLGSATLAATGAIALGVGVWAALARLPRELTMGGETWSLLEPRALYLLVALALLLPAPRHSLADLPRAQLWLSALARAALIAVLALALARPARTTESALTSTVFLVDVSDSIQDEALVDAHATVQAAWRARGKHDVQLVTFARHPRVVPLPTQGDTLPPIERHRRGPGLAGGSGARPPAGAGATRATDAIEDDASTPPPGAGTDLEAAMRLAYGLFPEGRLRRVVLLTDGVQTHGDALAEAARARRMGIRVSYFPDRRGVPPEVALRGLHLPERIEVGAPFAVRATLFASRPGRARVRLRQEGGPNALDPERTVDLVAGEQEVAFRSVVRVPGPVTYAAEVTPEGPDRFAENNRVTASALVPGRPTVLLVEADPARATYLARALVAGELEVDVRAPRELPSSARELDRYDFVVLSDVPADAVSLGQQEAIERYVRDLGGGFLMAGGAQGFGLGGWQGTRIEQLLPVRMDAERRRDQPSLALALVIDKSGSMTGLKMELAKDAAKAAAELLSSEDYIEVIGFDSQPTRVVRMQSAANRLRILTDIGRIAPSGGTALLPAMNMAYEDLAVTRARIKHVIMLTDGQTQESSAQMETLVRAMRAEGITVSTVGLGGDVNRGLLQTMANLGSGRAYFTSDPHNVPRIFTRETSQVQRSSAVEEYFQPIVSAPADFLRGLDVGSSPYLHGYVATQAKPAPAQVVLRSELSEPLLARWRVGLGWALAWTSDVKNRWAVEWLRWPGFQPFWTRLVREHMRQRRSQTLDMRAEVVGDELRVEVDAIGPDDRFINGLDSTVTVRGAPGASAFERTLPLRQTAPGRYEARLPLERFGAFVLEARHLRDGRQVAESRAQVSHPYPLEYATLAPPPNLLARVASLTGGDEAPSPERLFDARGETIRAHEELWPHLLAAALALFLWDLLLRRVRLFDRRFRAPARGVVLTKASRR